MRLGKILLLIKDRKVNMGRKNSQLFKALDEISKAQRKKAKDIVLTYDKPE